LYISKWSVDAPQCDGASDDVGSAALRLLLTSDALAQRWSVAAHIADARARLSAEQPAQEEQRLAATETANQNMVQFVRAGFEKMRPKERGWLGMTKSMAKTTADVELLRELHRWELPPPPTSDQELVETVLARTVVQRGGGVASFFFH